MVLQRPADGRHGWPLRLAAIISLLILLSACGAASTATPLAAPLTPSSTTQSVASSPTALVATVTVRPPLPLTPSSTGTPTQVRGGSPTSALPVTTSCAPLVDLVGFSDALNKTTFASSNVGGLSGLVYDRANDRYYGVVDNEGTTPARVYTLRIPLVADQLGTPQVTAITTLVDMAGKSYTGRTLDGEGLALLPGGDLLVASETEPSIKRFAPDGHQLAELPVPQRFLVAPKGEATNNLTFESLALTPDGNTLYTAVEEPLKADGRDSSGRGLIRLLRYDNRQTEGFVPTAQYFYQSELAQGVSDLLALSSIDFLVLERGFIPSVGNTIRLYRISLADAPDVSNQPTLASANLAPVRKELLVDLRNCPAGAAKSPEQQPNPLLDNVEGITLGPTLSDGRRLLVLVSDDNFGKDQVTRVIALAIRP